MAFVELPAVYLDDVVVDESSSGIILLNRAPDSGETNVLVNSNISVDIADLTAIGLDASATQIFVDINAAGEVLAFDGGVFQSGFTGPGSAVSAPDADTTRVVIDPTSPLSSLDSVTVRVVAETTGGGNTIDESYTFTVQDIDAPGVLAASARDLKIVRVTFDEPVKQVGSSESGDALNPANYLFTPEADQVPAVTAVGSSVASVNSSTVDVTTDIELSMGKVYKVTVTGVSDLQGNTN